MKAFLLHMTASVFVVAIALALYDRLVVDIADVYRAKEAQFAQLLTKAGNDDDRARALALARAFAQRLPAALDELPRDCRCLVLVKSSLAGSTPSTIDLTAQLKKKVE
jgi:hypothetical protein